MRRRYKNYDSKVVIGVCIHTHVEAVFSVGGTHIGMGLVLHR